MKQISTDSFSVIRMSGPDTEDLLGRILSQKIPFSRRAFGAALLEHRGRAKAIFFGFRNDENDYLLVCEKKEAESAKGMLEEAVFAEDVRLEFVEDSGLSFVFSEDGPISELAEDLVFCSSGAEFYLTKTNLNGESISIDEFSKILKLYGALSLDVMHSRVFIESSTYLQFIHDDKGCYPGQEVINKILSIGQVPKTYLVLELDRKLENVENLSMNGQQLKECQLVSKQDKHYLTSFVRTKLVENMDSKITIESPEGSFSATRFL